MWGWALRFAAEGWTATRAAEYLREFSRFRDAPWYRTFREAFAQVGYRESIKRVPMTYIIPPTMMGAPREIDWEFEYNYIARIRFYNPETLRWEEKDVQVGSDVLQTKRDWRLMAEEVFGTLPGSPSFDPERGLQFITEEVGRRVRR